MAAAAATSTSTDASVAEPGAQQLAVRLVAAHATLQESLERTRQSHAGEIAQLSATHAAAIAALTQTLRDAEAASRKLAADLAALTDARNAADRYMKGDLEKRGGGREEDDVVGAATHRSI